MYLMDGSTPEFEAANERCKKLTRELVGHLKPKQSDIRILAGQTLYSTEAEHGKLYHIREGALSYACDGRIIFYFDEGDFIGFEHFLKSERAEISSEFAVKVDEYLLSDFFIKVSKDRNFQALWHEYIGARFSVFNILLSSLAKGNRNPPPDVKVFEEGAVIINEGGRGEEVYTLIDGQADVLINNVKIGEIFVDEIFGALAALTDSPRTATVVAKTNCVVLALSKEKFFELIESRPATVVKLIEDMARAIVDLNKQVGSYHFTKG